MSHARALEAAPRRRRLSLLVSGLVYLAAAVGLWWHVWSAHPSSTMTCGCTDAGFFMWFLDWTTFALAHGQGWWHSAWLFHPGGVNLMSNTSVMALGLVLSPVTLLFGPVVTMNVASTLAPALTALSMLILLRRWTSSDLAAFVGGLAYGFSPFVIVQLSFGWLNFTFLALLPLMVLCLDELLVRQRRSPVVVGVILGLLVVVELFVSTELLLLLVVAGVVGAVVVGVWALLRHRRATRRRLIRARPGLAAAAIVAVLGMAYPVWYALGGPAHLSGPVWATSIPGDLGSSPGDFWSRLGEFGPVTSPQLTATAHQFGGYQGQPWPAPAYLGWGFLAVLVVGTVVWHRDRRLGVLAAIGGATALFSLRVGGGGWGPWALIEHLPLLRDAEQAHLSAVVDLCAAAMLAIVVDHTSTTVVSRWPSASRAATRGRGSAAALAVSAIALVPVVLVLAPNLPLTMQPVAVPSWFSHQAARAAATGRATSNPPVVLTYPTATVDTPTAMVWQAAAGSVTSPGVSGVSSTGMAFKLVGGGGPGGAVSRAGAAKAGYAVLTAASLDAGPAPEPDAGNLEAVRSAMVLWRATVVVVPNPSQLPTYLRGRRAAYAVGWFTALLGASPRYVDDAWVWNDVEHAPPALSITPGAFARCTAGLSPRAGFTAASCVERAAGAGG